MDTLPNIDELLLQITALKGPKLLLAFIILLGYFIKQIKFVPNDKIPIIGAASAMVLSPILVSWPDIGSMEPNLKYAEIAAWVQIEIQALLLWATAWFLHAVALRPLIDEKLKKLGIKVNGNGHEKPEAPLTPPVAP